MPILLPTLALCCGSLPNGGDAPPPAVAATLSYPGPLLCGTTSALELSAPTLPGGAFLAAAALDDRPGLATPVGLVALAPDALFASTLGAAGFSGVLDGDGRGSVALTVPDDPSLAGITLHAAAVVLDATGALAISNTLARRIRTELPSYDFGPVDAVLASFSDGWLLNDGVAFVFVQNGAVLHASAFGAFDLDTRVPWASATKWFASAALETLVDRGHLALDDPLSELLPALQGASAALTYRQAYAHTSGLPGQWPCLGDTSSTLQACAASIAGAPLLAPPGEAFAYGGSSMHAAGAAIELLTGLDYESWFRSALAEPLGATTLAHDGFGPTANPRVAAGLMGTALDHAPLLIALLDGGAVDGRSVLSTRAVQELLSDQTDGLPVLSTPFPEALGYGLGCWVEAVDADGRPTRLSSPGAFGATPWVDLELGYGAFVLIRRTTADGRAIAEAVRPLLEALAAEG